MTKNKWIFQFNERKISTIPEWVFHRMHEIASEEDIDKGGLLDSRGGGAINIWVSPEDKPEDYSFEITYGVLNFPREYLATIYQNSNNGYVDLYLTIDNAERRLDLEKRSREFSFQEYREQVKLARQGTKLEWEWATEKTMQLIVRVLSMGEGLEHLGFIKCAVCGDIIRTSFMNEYLDHLIEKDNIRFKTLMLAGYDSYIVTQDDKRIYLYRDGSNIEVNV